MIDVTAAAADPVVLGEGLEKRYGRKRVLRGVSFAVPRGGFLVVTGANGAGKTTLLRLVAGLAAPTRGMLEVSGERRDLGFVGHEPLVYQELTALENLELFGRLYRVADRRERSGMLLERFGHADEAEGDQPVVCRMWKHVSFLGFLFARTFSSRAAACGPPGARDHPGGAQW